MYKSDLAKVTKGGFNQTASANAQFKNAYHNFYHRDMYPFTE